jgi:hypothetical protein
MKPEKLALQGAGEFLDGYAFVANMADIPEPGTCTIAPGHELRRATADEITEPGRTK